MDYELGSDADGPFVIGLNMKFRTKEDLKQVGYAFAFKYGSAGLAKAMAHLGVQNDTN